MSATPSFNGVVRLDHLGLIRASGADTAKFLHGQLSSDFAMLGLSQSRLAGFCSAKGRLQASLLAWKASHDEVLLACSADLLAPTAKRLSMFVLRLQCRLSDARGDFALFGAVGDSAATAAGELAAWGKRDDPDGWTVRLPDVAGHRRALVGRKATPSPLDAPGARIDSALWRWLDIQAGLPWIEQATVDQFVPQMVNLELLGGVDFKKGCYPGQEVVARSQYRGTLKRRMFLFDMEAPAHAGQEVFHDADPGQPAGMVVNAAPNPFGAGSSALVEVKLVALAGGRLHLGAPNGAVLQRRPLPYEVPFEQAQDA
jgi:folate-binding protein YgfZ